MPSFPTPAHPRRCGDHYGKSGVPFCAIGSSPQVRGPRCRHGRYPRPLGLIPAGAGTTPTQDETSGVITAHPRRCGDHFLSLGLLGGLSGSSPQVRGPRFHALSLKLGTRLIPAGAGTTTSGTMPGRPCQAHPRRCGDHEAEITRPGAETGSSPQVRGPQDDPNNTTGDTGLIPAGAGTTTQLAPSTTRQTAHPRRCGDHVREAYPAYREAGSSPQVRGPRHGATCRYSRQGLIPAGAGTTATLCRTTLFPGAHPRRCGDHSDVMPHNPIPWGSSPQVRGPQSRPKYPSTVIGLIPAGAGTTTQNCIDQCIRRAHPRRCGDHPHKAGLYATR